MEIYFGLVFLIIVSFSFGYFTGYNKGFDAMYKIHEKCMEDRCNYEKKQGRN